MATKLTIDTVIAKRMIEANALFSASIIGQAGGWSVLLKFGAAEKTLGAQRSDKPRLWKSLDHCVDFLKTELHIARFELLDATQFSLSSAISNHQVAERMRETHQAAAYVKWLDAEVQEAIDDTSPSIPNEEVQEYFAQKRTALRKRIAAENR